MCSRKTSVLESMLKLRLLQAKRAVEQPQSKYTPTEHRSEPYLASSEGLDNASAQAVPHEEGEDCDIATDGTQHKPAQANAQASTSSDTGFATSECIICWEAAPNVLLQPCGHICACSGCAAWLEHSDCPMCRCKEQCSIVLQL